MADINQLLNDELDRQFRVRGINTNEPLDVGGQEPPDRGFIEEVGVGLVRGPLQAAQSLGEAIELVSPSVGQGITDFVESISPEPSGGVVEEAIASAGQSILTTGALAGVTLATSGSAALAAGVAGVGTGVIFGAAEATRTREFLTGINEQLVRQGVAPLTDGQIREAMVANAAIEGAGESLANFILAKVGLRGTRAVKQAKDGIRHLLQSPGINEAVKRAGQATLATSKALGQGAFFEAGTEAAQGAAQAAVLQGVVGQKSPRTRLQTPGEAALQAAAPAALAGAIFGGVEISGQAIRDERSRRRVEPLMESGRQMVADLHRPQPQEPTASGPRAEADNEASAQDETERQNVRTPQEARAAFEERQANETILGAIQRGEEQQRQQTAEFRFARESQFASDDPRTRADRLATLTPDEFLAQTGRAGESVSFRQFVDEEFFPHILDVFSRGMRAESIVDPVARQQFVENLNAALHFTKQEAPQVLEQLQITSGRRGEFLLPPGRGEFAAPQQGPPRRFPLFPSAEVQAERQSVQAGFERIVRSDDGRVGIVATNQFGVLEFREDTSSQGPPAPGIQRAAVASDEFNLLFGSPLQGIDPGAITAARVAFANTNQITSPVPVVIPPLIRPPLEGGAPAGEPTDAEVVGGQVPTEDRLRNAERQARDFLQDQLAKGEIFDQAPGQGLTAFPLGKISTLVRRMTTQNQISEEDANEIATRVFNDISDALEVGAQQPGVTRQLEDVEAQPSQEEQEQSAQDVALDLVTQSIDEDGPFPNRFENREAFNQRVGFLAELLEAQTGLGGTRPLVGEGAPGALPDEQLRQLTGAFDLVSRVVTQIGEEQPVTPTPQEPLATQVRLDDVVDDAQQRQADRNIAEVPEIIDRAVAEAAPPPRPGQEIEPPVTVPPEPSDLKRVDDAANQPVTRTEGVDAIVKTVPGTASAGGIEVKYAVVDANTLLTSVDQAGNVNPNFPAELQPRDRTSITTQSQINDLINKLDPAQLAESQLANFGSPIVGEDMVVEAGNGRTLALQRMYTLGIRQATDYQAFLHDNAERFGLSKAQVRATQRPVLIRVRRTPMTMAERAQFAIDANQRSEAAFSTAEQAQVDARALTRDVVAIFNPSRPSSARKILEGIAARQNLPFARRMLQGLPVNDQPGILNNRGEISQNGARRILNAVFMRVYGNSAAFNQLAEDVDDNIANIVQAMTMAMPSMLRMKLEIEEGFLPDLDLDPTAEIASAASKLSSLRQQEETVGNYFNQTNLFGGDELSPVAKDYLKLLDGEGRGFRRLEEVLSTVAERVRQMTTQFMGENDIPSPTKGTILAAAIEQVEARHGIRINLSGPDGSFTETEATASLFGAEAAPQPGTGVVGEGAEGQQAQETEQPAVSEIEGVSVQTILNAINEVGPIPAVVASRLNLTRDQVFSVFQQLSDRGLVDVPVRQRDELSGRPAVSEVGEAVEELNGLTIRRVTIGGDDVFPVTDAEGNMLFRANSLEGARQRIRDRFPSQGAVIPPADQPSPPGPTPLELETQDAVQASVESFTTDVSSLLESPQARDRAAVNRMNKRGAELVRTLIETDPPTTNDLAQWVSDRMGGPITKAYAQQLISEMDQQAFADQAIPDGLVDTLGQAFQSRNVRRTEDGQVELRTGRGSVFVRVVERIDVDGAAVELGYGRTPTQEEIESGAVASIQQKNGRFEMLITPDVSEEIIFHEAGHFFEDAGVLTQKDIQTLNTALSRQKQLHTAENRADLLGARLQEAAANNPVGRVVAKAQAFMDKLARGLGIETTGQIVRRIQRGGPDGAPLQNTPQRFALGSRREGQQRDHKAITPEIEGKLYRAYANFRNMFSPEVVAQFNQEFPKERKSIPEMDLESTAIAVEWHDKPGILARQMGQWSRADGNPTAAQARALISIAQGMWQDRRNALEAGQISQGQFDEFLRQWLGLNGLLNYAQMAISEAGFLLRLTQELPPVGAFIHTMNKLKERRDGMTPEQVEKMDKAINDAFAAGDRQTLRNLGKQMEAPTMRGYFWEWFYGSVLSSPATFNINLFSTYGFIQFHNAIVRGTTAILDPAVARLQGRARQHHIQEVIPAFAAGFKGIPKGAGRFWSLWRPGKKRQELPPEITKFRREQGEAPGSWARAEHLTSVPMLGIKKGDPITWMRRLAPIITFATRGLEAADVAMRELAFDTELQARAIRASIQQNGRRDTNFETNYINTVSDRPAELKAIMEMAKELTFTDAPGVVARNLIRLRNLPVFGPFLQLLMPFAATPERLLRRGWEFVPGGTFIPTMWRGVNFAGWLPGSTEARFTQEFLNDPKVAEIFAKQLIGAVLTMSMFALWKEGMLTGDAPAEEAEREAFFRQGNLPYAFKGPGGTVVQWRRFEPLSLPLGMAVAGFEAISKIQKDREERGEALFSRGATGHIDDTVSIAATVAHSMTYYIVDGSYFRGLAEFMGSATQRPSGSIQRGLMRQFIAATVPFSSAQRSLIRLQDAIGSGEIFIREEGTPVQQFQGSNLFLPRAPVRAGVTGRPTSQRPIFGAAEAVGLPPIRTSTITDDPVELALERADFAPGSPSRRNLQKALKRSVTDDEFRQFVTRRGEIARTRIERLVEAPFFNRLTQERQAARLKGIFRQASRRARRELQRAQR